MKGEGLACFYFNCNFFDFNSIHNRSSWQEISALTSAMTYHKACAVPKDEQWLPGASSAACHLEEGDTEKNKKSDFREDSVEGPQREEKRNKTKDHMVSFGFYSLSFNLLITLYHITS